MSVSPQDSGTTPTGTVTISGANCQITLSSGNGSCTLPAAYFNAGNRQMVATYNGSSSSQAVGFVFRPSPSQYGNNDDKTQAVYDEGYLPR